MNGKSVILGLNLVGHDVSYTLIDKSGIPITIAEEERYSRVKKGTFVPNPSTILEITDEYGLSAHDISRISIANIRELAANRSSTTNNEYPPFANSKICDSLLKIIVPMFPNLIEIVHLKHHLCHAASAFFPSPFKKAAVVTADGMGENDTASIWYGENNELSELFSISHPHSIGYLYKVAAQWIGLTGGEKEGKLMGLASYGTPIYKNVFYDKFLKIDDDKGIVLNHALEARPCSSKDWLGYFEEQFGGRNQLSEIKTVHKDIAASIQEVLEEVLLHILYKAKSLTKTEFCCAAGGVFMNSMANYKLRRSKLFCDFWVQPLSSDNGLSLGAALWTFYQGKNNIPRWQMKHPFWGSNIADLDIMNFVKDKQVEYHKSDNVELETAKLLASGKIVGWVQGRSEVGARSLGHRSIFADPRDATIKEKINDTIKNREYWRPFAPIVLEDMAHVYFQDDSYSPFMMFASPAKEDCPLAAALHVDNTGRLQTINKEFDERVYKLIKEFENITGVGALLNTSFNLLGEPIVRTIEHAYYDFISSGMDVLVVNDYIFKKPIGFSWQGKAPKAQKPFITFSYQDEGVFSYGDSIEIISLGYNDLLPLFVNYIRQINPHLQIREFQSLLTPCRDFKSVILREPRTNQLSQILLTSSDLTIFLVIPVWKDIALDTIPNFLRPYINILQYNPNIRIFCVDKSGLIVSLKSILPNEQFIIDGGILTGIEHYYTSTVVG